MNMCKKRIVLLALVALFIWTGCGNGEIHRLRKENESLKQKVRSLEKEAEQLKSTHNATPAGAEAPSSSNATGELVISYTPGQNGAIQEFLEKNSDYYPVLDNEKLRAIRKRLEKSANLKDIPLTACWGDLTGDGGLDLALILQNRKTRCFSVTVFNGSSKNGYDEPIILQKEIPRCDYVIFVPPDKNFKEPLIHIQQIDSSGGWIEFYWDKKKGKYVERLRTDSD